MGLMLWPHSSKEMMIHGRANALTGPKMKISNVETTPRAFIIILEYKKKIEFLDWEQEMAACVL